jgi:hypothetical protein
MRGAGVKRGLGLVFGLVLSFSVMFDRDRSACLEVHLPSDINFIKMYGFWLGLGLA